MPDSSAALEEPFFWGTPLNSCRYAGKVSVKILALVSLLVGFGFAVLLSLTSYTAATGGQHPMPHEELVTTAWEYMQSATAQHFWQFRRPAGVWRLMQRRCIQAARAGHGCPFDHDSDGLHGHENQNLEGRRGISRDRELEYVTEVQSWTERVVIGLGLCPWASGSYSEGNVNFVACEGDKPSEVAQLILREADRLTRKDVAPRSTTLVVCPRVAAWNNFDNFEAWVNLGIDGDLDPDEAKMLQAKVALVAFHPRFLRWRALPEEIRVGSIVQSHYATAQGLKSEETELATVIDTDHKVVGVRRIGVRFNDDGQEQDVPIEWLAHSISGVGPPLLDNAMHRTPHPTIHLIRRADLNPLLESVEGYNEVHAMTMQNVRRLGELGWEGLRKLAQI